MFFPYDCHFIPSQTPVDEEISSTEIRDEIGLKADLVSAMAGYDPTSLLSVSSDKELNTQQSCLLTLLP